MCRAVVFVVQGQAGRRVTTMVAQWPDKADDEGMRVNVAVPLGFVRRRRKEVVGKKRRKGKNSRC